MVTYEVTATVKGVDNTIITITKFFNHALSAKAWAVFKGHANVVLHKFNL